MANRLPQVALQNPSPASTCSTNAPCVDCSCGKSGSISCNVPQPAANNYPQNGGKSYAQQQSLHPANAYQQNIPFSSPQNIQPGASQRQDLASQPNDTAFTFCMRLNDSVDKDFHDFVTNNFIKREIPLQVAEIHCESNPLTVLEDPVCKEFLNLFTQTFMRKPENSTSSPEHLQTATLSLKPTTFITRKPRD